MTDKLFYCDDSYKPVDESMCHIMPPVHNTRPCQIPIRAERFRYLTKEFIPGTGDKEWIMFHHPGHFMIYDRNTHNCIADASYGMMDDLESCMDDKIIAIVFEMRLALDKNGQERDKAWEIVLDLFRSNNTE